jgi:hypothetical protein
MQIALALTTGRKKGINTTTAHPEKLAKEIPK